MGKNIGFTVLSKVAFIIRYSIFYLCASGSGVVNQESIKD